ncbi:MBL fold metallo-hydrolase [Halosquirtibacter xylanolyticus]|uniref:MBL fold metallo-hydrolase n=1 Tax=Halosquirtibacter xylanolyticus TaxID=3374599 RepID=UPI0037498930|nr:MBL fold metallo-hydrolase [Prolixibacteraceae bacterium]
MGIGKLNQTNTIETILIGTGGGYGESIILNLGNDTWVVIDSCKNPNTKKSLPLEYLEERGVNLEEDVKLIICTHWHEDHIRGLSDLYEKCESAILSFAHASDRTKFLQLVGLDHNKTKNEETACSTEELNACLKILASRKGTMRKASEDRVLLSNNSNGINFKVISLSPSDYIMSEFDEEISTLITDYGVNNRKIINHTPNDKSVAILVKINDQRIILGSDLEVNADKRKGWKCIINNSQTLDGKSNVFKIPHHGSDTGYNKEVWDVLMDENTVIKLSPYSKNKKLPKSDMINTFLGHSDRLYITSIPTLSKAKPKKRHRSIAKAIDKFNPTLIEVKFNKGVVRCVCDLEIGEWNVETIESATKISHDNVSQF